MTILSLSNRAKAYIYPIFTLAYAVGFGELWKHYLKYQFINMPEFVSTVVFIVGFVVPATALAAASFKYYSKRREELGSATNFSGYLELWRGNESLPRVFWTFVPFSTLLIILAGQRLIFALVNEPSSPSLETPVIEMTMFLGFHAFVAVGMWRSAGKYRGPRIWPLLAKASVALSFVALMVGLILGWFGYNLFTK